MRLCFKFIIVFVIIFSNVLITTNFSYANSTTIPLYDLYSPQWFTILFSKHLEKTSSGYEGLKALQCQLYSNQNTLKKLNPALDYYVIQMDNRVDEKINCFVGVDKSDLIIDLIITGPPPENEAALMQVLDIALASLQTFGFSKEVAREFIKNTLTSNNQSAVMTHSNRIYGLVMAPLKSIFCLRIAAWK